MYDSLSLINSTHVTTDILLCTQKNLYLIHGSHSPFHRENVFCPAGSVPPPSHLTSCTPTKSDLCFHSSFDTLSSEPALYKLSTFHIPNVISIFRRLGRLLKESIQVRGPQNHFVTGLCFLR
jgi:hypothetical protein